LATRSDQSPSRLSDNVADYYAARAEEYDLSAGYRDPNAERCRATIKTTFRDALRGRDALEIACGTGYWTAVIAPTARSVVAIDSEQTMIAAARRRLSCMSNVRCLVADAYALDGIYGPFDAAFAHWWWSHVPIGRIRTFLTTLHARLRRGALVLFADQLLYTATTRRRDNQGDLLEARIVRDGSVFDVVKNFPTAPEIIYALRGLGHTVLYRQYPLTGQWTLSYRAR
jgi:demethylmenaquinone methyltransferase/2-methoxy-6-polyprenyl-1,4-benzoquinol methylase